MGRRARATDTTIIVSAIILGLYFGRDVLVPISMAVLLSFVLAPVTVALGRLRIGRVTSVLLAVGLAFAILIGLGAVIGKQVAQLAENLPQYQVVIAEKLRVLAKRLQPRGGRESRRRPQWTPRQSPQIGGPDFGCSRNPRKTAYRSGPYPGGSA